MTINKVAVITGGARGIGKAIAKEFANLGVKVCIIDKLENNYYIGDISKEEVLIEFTNKVIKDYGKIDYLINNACLSNGGLLNCSFEDFNYTLKVGVTAPFILTKLFMNNFNLGGSIVNISSTRHMMSQENTESYSAAKGGITSLTHAMAVTLAGKVRVNSVSPGWIDTTDNTFEDSDNLQHLVGRVGKPEDIVNVVMFLCSQKSSFITGQDIIVDGGMTKLMIYNDDKGWKFEG